MCGSRFGRAATIVASSSLTVLLAATPTHARDQPATSPSTVMLAVPAASANRYIEEAARTEAAVPAGQTGSSSGQIGSREVAITPSPPPIWPWVVFAAAPIVLVTITAGGLWRIGNLQRTDLNGYKRAAGRFRSPPAGRGISSAGRSVARPTGALRSAGDGSRRRVRRPRRHNIVHRSWRRVARVVIGARKELSVVVYQRGPRPTPLIDIEGIGPTLSRQLRGLGIHSAEQLASLDDAGLERLRRSLGHNVWRLERGDWRAAARRLVGEAGQSQSTFRRS